MKQYNYSCVITDKLNDIEIACIPAYESTFLKAKNIFLKKDIVKKHIGKERYSILVSQNPVSIQ